MRIARIQICQSISFSSSATSRHCRHQWQDFIEMCVEYLRPFARVKHEQICLPAEPAKTFFG